MNAREHIIAGMITTSTTYLIASNALGQAPTLDGLLTAAIIGLPTGLALDFIEPASHPDHRGLAHSTAALGGLIAYATKHWSDPALAPSIRVWVIVILAGIISHHVLDATTTRRPPLVGLHLC